MIAKTGRSLLGGLLVAASLAACSGGEVPVATATLHILVGNVNVADQGGAYQPARDGMQLEVGDTVRTAADGRAEIRYFEDSTTRLDFGTMFTIVTLQLDDDGSTIIEGEQFTGNTYSRVTTLINARSRFGIETPSAVAGVQGTEYAVLIGAEDGSTTVVVIDQEVRVTNLAGGETVVEAGFSVILQRPEISTPGDPEPITTPAEVLESAWLLFNSVEG